MAFAFATAQPFQKPLYTNFLFVGAFVLAWVISSVITLSPIGRLADVLQLLTSMPWSYRCACLSRSLLLLLLIAHRWRIWLFSWLCFAVALLWERFVVENP